MKLHSKHDQKSISKMVLAKQGKKRTAEHIARCRNGRIYMPLTAEHKAKISKGNKGKIVSYETIQKRRATMMNNPLFRSPEYRKKLSDIAHLNKHKRIRTYMENKFNGKLKANGRKIVDIDTGEIYFGATDVANKFKVTRSAVSYAILHKQRTCGGKRFVYLSNIGLDETNTNVEVIRKEFREYVDVNKIPVSNIKSDDIAYPTLIGFYRGKNVRNSTLALIVKLLHKLKLDKAELDVL